MQKSKSFIVTISGKAAEQSDAEIKDYVREAVASWGGSFEPPREENNWTGDPFFRVGSKNVIVKRFDNAKD